MTNVTTYLPMLLAVTVGFSLTMIAAWWIQKQTGKSGWIDVTWTYSVGLAGVVFALWPFTALSPRQLLVAALVAIWSLRLGTHVALRTARSQDDPRYAQLKKDWGAQAQSKMFGFLQVQALAGVLLSLAVLAAAWAPRPDIDWRDIFGALVLLGCVAGETLADSQLKAFAKNPDNRGKVCDVALWRYSRHPNYFFEWALWFAFPIIAMSADYPFGWVAWIGPAYMYYLLVHVSGIPPLEEHMMRTRPETFAAYARRTNAFFPGPARK